jgi:hypothetical protein
MVALAGGQIDEAEDGFPEFLKIPSKLYRMDVSVIKRPGNWWPLEGAHGGAV